MRLTLIFKFTELHTIISTCSKLEVVQCLNLWLMPISLRCYCNLYKTMHNISCHQMNDFLTSLVKILVFIRDVPHDVREVKKEGDHIQRADEELLFLNRLSASLSKYFYTFFIQHERCGDAFCYESIMEKKVNIRELICFIQCKSCELINLPLVKGRNSKLNIRQKICRLLKFYRRNNRMPAIDLRGSSLEEIFSDELTTRSLQTSSKEASCSVCFDELRDSTDFSIIDCCSHLLCCSCAERMYFAEDDDKR